ncbi:MAG TPA: sodium:proton antiporter, partial [Euryarchaeota archaeon]|nr:sodium:proton antiporter [Euryarchaeota archaeon]
GGGFQGGSALAVVPLLIFVAFSKYALEGRGLTKDTAMIVRSIGLISIIILVLIPLAAGGYLMQNLPVFPSHILGQLTSGSLVFYNLFEYIAVGAGFTAVFLLLSIPEKVFHKILGGEKE